MVKNPIDAWSDRKKTTNTAKGISNNPYPFTSTIY
jgi:hypothetical protein